MFYGNRSSLNFQYTLRIKLFLQRTLSLIFTSIPYSCLRTLWSGFIPIRKFKFFYCLGSLSSQVVALQTFLLLWHQVCALSKIEFPSNKDFGQQKLPKIPCPLSVIRNAIFPFSVSLTGTPLTFLFPATIIPASLSLFKFHLTVDLGSFCSIDNLFISW